MYQSQHFFTFTTEHFDFLDEHITVQNNNLNEIYPTNLSKSRFRLSTNDRQLLVITFYFKKPNDDDGTILVQGIATPTFAVDEFNALEEVVNSIDLLNDENIQTFNAMLDSIPLCEITNIDSSYDSKTSASVEYHSSNHQSAMDDEMFHESVVKSVWSISATNLTSSNTTDDKESTETTGSSSIAADSTIEKQVNTDGDRTGETTESSKSRADLTTDNQHNTDGDTTTEITESSKSDTHSTTGNTCNKECETQTDNSEFLRNISGEIYPILKKEMSNEISMFKLHIRNEQKAIFESMDQEFDDLRLKLSNAKVENQKLISQMNEYKKQMHKCDLQMQGLNKEINDLKSTANIQSATIQDLNITITNLKADNTKQTKDTNARKSDSNKPPAIPQNTHDSNIKQIDQGNESSDYPQAMTYTVPVQNRFECLLNDNTNDVAAHNKTPPRPIPVLNGHHLSDPASKMNYASALRKGHIHNVPVNEQHLSDHMKKSASMLSSQNPNSDFAMKYNSPGQNNFASENCNRLDKELPLNILKTQKIDSSTDYLIIGDSCINKLNPNKMNTGSYQYVQKICVSGMQTSDLLTWLDSQHVNTTLSKIVVHVGVNDNDNGIIMEHIWSIIISKLQFLFPNAHITMSSIIPTRTIQQTNINITQSNSYLQKSCNLFRCVDFVDHTNAFRTSNNAPKQVLYDNYIQKHPSLKGVRVLAKNIKWYGVDLKKMNESKQQMSMFGNPGSVYGNHIDVDGRPMYSPIKQPQNNPSNHQPFMIQNQPYRNQQNQTTMNQPFQQITSIQGDNNHVHDHMNQLVQKNGVTDSDGKGNTQSFLPIKPYSLAHEINSEKSEIFNQLNLLLQKLLY